MAVVKVDVRFSDNVAELKERIAAGTGAIEVMKQSVDRAAASIGGQGLFIQANKLTAAIDQVGGVTKLTSAEIDRHSATIDKAIEKYKVMGMTAPPAMVELAASLKQAGDAANTAGEKSGGFFSGMVAHIAEGILIRDAVHEILGVMKEMILALPEMAMKGSEIASVRHGFELLAGSTKNADDIMQAMRTGVRGTVPDFALMQNATKMLSAGVNINAADFGTLTEASVVLAHRGFGTTIEILDKLSTAMITGKTKTVAKMMGVIDAKGAELEYQTALDTGVDKLTAAGKAEAVRIAIVDMSASLVKNAGEQHLTYAERVAQAKTAVTNFTDSLSVAIATSPVIMTAMDSMANAVQGAFGKNQAETVEMLIGWINKAAIVVVDIGIAATQVATVFIAAWGVIKTTVLGVMTVVMGVIDGIVEAVVAADKVANKLHLVPDGEVAAMVATRDQIRGMTVDMATQTVEASKMVTGQSDLNVSVDKGGGALYVMRDKMQAASDAGVKHGDVLNALGQKHQDLTRHSEKLTAAQLAWKKVVEDVESAGENLETTLGTMDSSVVEGVKYYLAAGVAQGTLATYYGLTAVQVKAVETAVKNETEASKLMAEIHKQTFAMAEANEKGWRTEAEKTAHAIDASVASTLATYIAFAEKNTELMLHGTALQIEQLDVAYRAEVAKLGERTAQNATFWDKAKSQIDTYYAHQKDAVYIDSKALIDNQQSTLREIADKHWTTYMKMKAAPEEFSAFTIEKFHQIAKAAEDAANGISHPFLKAFSDIAAAIPGLIQSALTGGGGMAGAGKAIGSMVGQKLGQGVVEDLTKNAPQFMGSALGKMFGSAIPMVGALAGPLIGKIIDVFSGGAEHLINPIRQAFVDAAGGISALDAKAHAAGVTLTAMLNAKNPEQYKKAIDDLNAALALQNSRQAFIDVNGGLDKLDIKAHTAGVTLDAMLDAKTPEAYKKAIDDLNAAFNFQDASMKTLDDTVKKYGLSLEEMGPAYRKGKLDEDFQTLYQDQKVLMAAGVDYAVILGKQAPKFQELIDVASKTGTAIPLEMKPAIEKMIELGLLTDDSGKKMTDVSKLTFAETLDSKFQTIIEKIGLLVDAITRGLGPAIANIPTPKPIVIPVVYGDPGARPSRGGDDPGTYAALGGLVTNHGVQYLGGGGSVLAFTPRGTDTVPAMLTPGEGVVNQTGMATLGASGLRALNRGDRSGGEVVQFSTAALERRLDQLSAALLAESRRAPERTGIAVRDALLQARVGRR